MEDLKARGLLKDTLVVWGGEFGRQPTAEYAVVTVAAALRDAGMEVCSGGILGMVLMAWLSSFAYRRLILKPDPPLPARSPRSGLPCSKAAATTFASDVWRALAG